MTRLAFALLILAAGILAAIPNPASGCAAAPHRGQSVSTAEETAFIVWDEKSKTEHFIRRASFRSTGYDFGFLVPTPNQPDLDIANDGLFSELGKITAPRIEYREEVREVAKDFEFGCGSKITREFAGAAMPASNAQAAPGGVEVLEQKRVGDYDAAVLAFRRGGDDTPERGAAELAKWLVKHGYESSDDIKKWLERYVKDGWYLTAFKIATPEPKSNGANPPGPPQTHDLRAKPIRMSFKTDRPFYPYREPEIEQTKPPGAERLLRVFVAASVRYAGKLGDGSKPWAGQTAWAGPLDESRWGKLYQSAKLTTPPADGKAPIALPAEANKFWLTEFEDRSSPRPGSEEVYFEPSTDASSVERPPHIITTTRTVVVTPWWHAAVYFGVPITMILGTLILWRVLRRA